jgi:carbamoyl-phosphate synthase small subunit
MKAILALEDGSIYRGRAYGASGKVGGEVVFNTSMSGYQEILTDPSYSGQIVVMTCPHIGNYGTNEKDAESGRPFVEGFVAREFSAIASSWRSDETLENYLIRHGVVAISDVDTRALVRHLRSRGAMRGIISTMDEEAGLLVDRARSIPPMQGRDLASSVSCTKKYEKRDFSSDGSGQRLNIVAYDFGIKRNIIHHLNNAGCDLTIVPAHTSADEVLSLHPDGVFLSNGPGDPEPLEYAVGNIRRLLGNVPVFGICLGHQLMGLALGGKTYKLKFGHRGGNHPVKNLVTNRVEITAQNHGFAVDPDSLDTKLVELTHMNLNDQTLEGLRHKSIPAFSVQYHPEASPGPHDSHYLFHEFKQLILDFRKPSCPSEPT